MTTFQLVARSERNGPVLVDAVENPSSKAPESFRSDTEGPFLSGSQDLVALAIVLGREGYTPVALSFVDRFLQEVDPESINDAARDLKLLLRKGDFDAARHLLATELDGVYVLSIDLKDQTDHNERITLSQDGVVLTDSPTQATKLPRLLHAFQLPWVR